MKFLKKLMVAAILLLVIAGSIVVMALYGWRVTYAPELENSWNAISAFGTWASVIVSAAGVVASFVAIWYAIRVPKEIAYQQNKIALFEKRYSCYEVIQNLLASASQMETLQKNQEIQLAFRMYLDNPEKVLNNESATVFALQLKRKETDVISGQFLFQNYDTKLLQAIIATGVDLILQTASKDENEAVALLSTEAKQSKKNYCEMCKKYRNTYLEQMEKELQLSMN